jgi:alpha-mannosidase
VLSALKPSEQGVIVRVYEAAGKPVKDARCEFAWPIASAEETDLIERPFGAAAKHDGKTLTFDLGPFEIKSFRLVFSD